MNESSKAATRPLPFPQSRTHSHSHAPSHSLGSTELKLLNNTSAKTAKGKHREEENWHFGWWDYVPLLEARKPPVQWTSSSLIITAHSTEPRVICLHFPSNKQFTLPSPPSLAASPASYEPPTLIAGSARDDWIFAYFPGVDVDGVGCLWNRSRMVDDWAVKEWRTYARGDAAVAARWLNVDREWVTADAGPPVRLPTLGPFIPLSNPVLLVVTESHSCNMYYTHPPSEQVKMLSASLSRRSSSREGQERIPGERVDGPRGLGRCTQAAIGFGYDESSILIATYSSFVPSVESDSFTANTSELAMSLAMGPAPLSEPVIISEWETWRDENIIEVCEIGISIQGLLLSLSTTPLPSIRNFPPPNRHLTDLTFVPSLPSLHQGPLFPSTPTQTHRHVTPQSSPATVHTHVTQSPGRPIHRTPVKGTPPKANLEKMKGRLQGAMYLLCTTLDLGHYASNPKSEVTLYTFWRNQADLVVQTWYYKRTSHLAVPSGIIMHLSPSQPTNSAQNTGVLLGVLRTDGRILKRKEGQLVATGRLQMLRLPDLQTDDSWEPTSIVCPVGPRGVDLPFSLAVSPNRTLVCAVSPSSLTGFGEPTCIHPHPTKTMHAAQDFGAQKTKKHLASSLEVAVQKRVMPSDIVHFLAMQCSPIAIIEGVLAAVLLNFDTNGNGLTTMWTNEVIGAAVEMYRTKSRSARTESEKNDLTSRYQVGHEICSLSACNTVWEDTFDSRGYDLDAVWYLTSLCSYFSEFLEKLLKECVEFSSDEAMALNLKAERGDVTASLISPIAVGNNAEDPFAAAHGRSSGKEAPTFDLSCSLTHLIHPYALDNVYFFLQHVRRFRAFLGSHAKAEEHYKMAREVLVDTIDSSGIALDALDKVIIEIRDEVKANADRTPDLARRCLVSLKPPVQYAALLQKIVSKITQVQVVDKSRLFVKPDDLVDGMLGLSLSAPDKMPDRDVISKGFLPGLKPPMNCIRCGGKSEISTKVNNMPGHASIRWMIWEMSWQTHCICGGLWLSKQ
ncbi:hypothetical protein DFH11DRAFT_48421 [Phellopilus nigrolimitatus]|nr:hypothetical protein DFH11DRAFT_48421 [Phellopilus nigrolimitatus]